MSPQKEQEWGKIQVYTGDGKGKTTAALGTALRAFARGKKVVFVYFDKGGEHYSERLLLSWLSEQENPFGGSISYIASGLDRVDKDTGRFRMGVTPEDIKEAENGWEKAKKIIKSGKVDLIVLDEINSTITLGMLKEEDVLPVLDEKPKNLEVICTGRNLPEGIREMADLVTEMKSEKHYFYHGAAAREGLDY